MSVQKSSKRRLSAGQRPVSYTHLTVVFSHVNEQPMKVMQKTGFVELVGEENFCPNISAALKRAEEIIEN